MIRLDDPVKAQIDLKGFPQEYGPEGYASVSDQARLADALLGQIREGLEQRRDFKRTAKRNQRASSLVVQAIRTTGMQLSDTLRRTDARLGRMLFRPPNNSRAPGAKPNQ